MYTKELAPARVEQLLAADDTALALLELERDPVFRHVAPEGRVAYACRSMDVGRDAAKPYRGQDVFEVASGLGLSVHVTEEPPIVAGLLIRAHYDAASVEIRVYAQAVRYVVDLLAGITLQLLDAELVTHLIVAHELFHHLDALSINPVHLRFPPVVTWHLGPVVVGRARVLRCREVAAHAFAKELLQLPFSPSLLDWLEPASPASLV